MIKISKSKWMLLPLTGMAACSGIHPEKDTRPNIIIILADDLGYSDLGCYGSEIQTPHLDSLAVKGVRCSHFYNASKSCPSRASLLTGLFPAQAGMQHMSERLMLKPGNTHIESYQGYIPSNVPTIADLLGAAGYYTCMSGKWHVGDSADHWPAKHGFQSSLFIPNWGSQYFSTKDFTMKIMSDSGYRYYPDTNQYMTDIIAENAIELLDKTPAEKPFFLYLAFNAPHTPLQAPDTLIEKYMTVYQNGWDSLIQQRFRKQKALGLLPANAYEPGRKASYADMDYEWNRLSEKDKWFLTRTMASYAAMIDRMDQNIGRVLEYLRKTGKLENTVIMFLSDNGATHAGGYTIKNNNVKINEVPGSKGYSGGPGHGWARLSNTPYRLFKSFSYEGGIASPMIACGPKYLAQNKVIGNAYFHIMDILPTCIELAGISYPKTFNGMKVKTVYHQSILPYLKKEGMYPDTVSSRILCWEHEGHMGIRKGKWKMTYIREFFYTDLLSHERKSEMVNKWQLFNLAEDPFENSDLSEQYPEIVTELKKNYADWATTTGVVDWERVNVW